VTQRTAVVGPGRMGTALVAAINDAGVACEGPFGRGFDGAGYDVVILAVPDGQIGAAVALIVDGPLVGHCAGSLGLDVLGRREAFSVHPLMTVTSEGARFEGAGAAIAGSSPRALATAHSLATRLGMLPVEIQDEDRAAYHAAASIASNFVVTLEDAAESLLATTGADRAILVPLVRAAIENWSAVGGRAALTGPIARGDDATVARQRAAVAERAPELIPLFNVLAERTRVLAERRP
jgi:predicted short-subunit dehydrogenase-like oxidoreductase (DUF2520 family)